MTPAHLEPLTVVDPKSGEQTLPHPWWRQPNGSFRTEHSAGGRLTLVLDVVPTAGSFVVRGILDDRWGPHDAIVFQDPTPYPSLEDAAWRAVRLGVAWVLEDASPIQLLGFLPEDDERSLAPAATILDVNYPTLSDWVRGRVSIPLQVRHHFLTLLGFRYDPKRYGWIAAV